MKWHAVMGTQSTQISAHTHALAHRAQQRRDREIRTGSERGRGHRRSGAGARVVMDLVRRGHGATKKGPVVNQWHVIVVDGGEGPEPEGRRGWDACRVAASSCVRERRSNPHFQKGFREAEEKDKY